jgi:cathepsin A (carboxypeptidase C)
MAYNSSTAPQRVDLDTYLEMKKATPKCIEDIKKCNQPGFPRDDCMEALMYCNMNLIQAYPREYNLYDMRLKCQKPPLCYDFSDVEQYLNSEKVQTYLGVAKKWESCNMQVNQYMQGDWMRRYQDQIPDLLASGIRVLIYAGDVDFICNWCVSFCLLHWSCVWVCTNVGLICLFRLGNRAWTLELEWPGKQDFQQAAERDWVVGGKAAGKVRNYKNFAFLQVYQAGHMVPLDQPEASLQMFDDFVVGGQPTTTLFAQ